MKDREQELPQSKLSPIAKDFEKEIKILTDSFYKRSQENNEPLVVYCFIADPKSNVLITKHLISNVKNGFLIGFYNVVSDKAKRELNKKIKGL